MIIALSICGVCAELRLYFYVCPLDAERGERWRTTKITARRPSTENRCRRRSAARLIASSKFSASSTPSSSSSVSDVFPLLFLFSVQHVAAETEPSTIRPSRHMQTRQRSKQELLS